MKVKYDWIHVVQGAETKDITFPLIDSGFFKDWTLLQIEGEEPVVHEEVDPKAKGAAAGKKPPVDPKKAASKLEEITDNRARTISYEKDFAVEGSGSLEVSQDIAVKFSETILTMQIFDTDRESSEETLVDTVKIDLSCLLFQEGPLNMSWRFDKLKPMALNYLNFTVKADQPLLSDYFRKKLNPLQINLVSIKDIPFKTEPKYKPIYATLEFIDGTSFTSFEQPQQPHCRFLHRHVFLVGQHDPVHFKELLATTPVRVILHDCDEYVSEDADHNFSVGVASFTLRDFLRPFCRELKLRSDVFPKKRLEADHT